MAAIIRNLTPHDVIIYNDDGEIIAHYPPEGSVARAQQSMIPYGEVNGIVVTKTTFGATENLPAPEDGVFLIVSQITASAAKAEGRSVDDLLLTSDTVRDETGKIIGCRKFAVLV